MIAFLIPWVAKLGIPARHARSAIFMAFIALALFAIVLAVKARDRRMIRQAEAAQQVKIEQDKLAQAAREREATAALVKRQREDDAASTTRQKEINDATKAIPDKAPSDRQRTRACLELRRQAKASGGPQPAC